MKISELPDVIQELVFKRQIEVDNKPNSNINLISSKGSGNFNWDETVEGDDFWLKIYDGHFDEFYKLYPNPKPILALPLSTKNKLEDLISDLSNLSIPDGNL